MIEELIEKAFCEGYEYAQREFTFADQETWKEIEQVLKGNHKMGDLKTAREAVTMGKLMRKVANSLNSKKTVKINITDEDKDILRKIGMTSSADNLEHFLNKYNNKELKDRWGKMYGKKLDDKIREGRKRPEFTEEEKNTLRELKAAKKEIKRLKREKDVLNKNIDFSSPNWIEQRDKYRDKRDEYFKAIDKEVDIDRKINRDFVFNKKRRRPEYSKDFYIDLEKPEFPVVNYHNPELADKIKERAKKEGLDINEDQRRSSYNGRSINLTKETTDSPEIIAHELGHHHDHKTISKDERSDRGFIFPILIRPRESHELNSRHTIDNIRSQFANGLRVGAEEAMASYRGNSMVRQEGGNPDIDHLKACGKTYNYTLGKDLIPMISEIERRKEAISEHKQKNRFLDEAWDHEYAQKEFALHSDLDREIEIGDLMLIKSEPLSVAKFIGKHIKPIGRAQEKHAIYDIYKDLKKVGIIELNEESSDEIFIEYTFTSIFSPESQAIKVIKYFINLAKDMGYKSMSCEISKDDTQMKDIYKKLGFKVYNELFDGVFKLKLKL